MNDDEAFAKNSLPKLEELEGMGFCRTYRYGDRVLKFMIPGKADSFEAMIKKWEGVNIVPKLVGRVEDIIILEWLEGKPEYKLNPNQIKEIGDALRKIHKSSIGFGKPKGSRFEFSNFAEWTESAKREILKDLDKKDVPLLEKLCHKLKDFNPKPVLVHGDFALNNIIWNKGKISGIIDFENSESAPAELDIANLKYTMDSYGSFSKDEFDTILKGYKVRLNSRLISLLEAYLCLKHLKFLEEINPKVAKKNRGMISDLIQ